MRRTWITGFVAGCLTTALVVVGLSLMPWPTPAEAQASEVVLEQTRYMRDMADSLKEIERALENRCP